jgi:hypothetical protein
VICHDRGKKGDSVRKGKLLFLRVRDVENERTTICMQRKREGEILFITSLLARLSLEKDSPLENEAFWR